VIVKIEFGPSVLEIGFHACSSITHCLEGENIHTFVQDWIYGFGAAIVPSAMHLYVHSTNMIIR